MKKENIFILLFILMIFGCNNVRDKQHIDVKNNPIVNSIDKSEIGINASLRKGYDSHPLKLSKKWNLCGVTHQNLMTNYNVCTEVILLPDGNGQTIKPDKSKCNFIWGCKGDSINFSFTTQKDASNFFSTSNLFFIDESKLNEIRLKVKKSTYYLR